MTTFADAYLRVHTSYGWSVPGASIDLEGELAIAMDPLTPAEVGRVLGDSGGAVQESPILFAWNPRLNMLSIAL